MGDDEGGKEVIAGEDEGLNETDGVAEFGDGVVVGGKSTAGDGVWGIYDGIGCDAVGMQLGGEQA